jgi:two-component system, OmpR family, sensor histidine kinase BaeS
MSVNRKLFVAMASFIVGMGLVFAFVTQIVLRDALKVMVEASRKEEIAELSRVFADHYKNRGSWEGIRQLDVRTKLRNGSKNAVSVVLLSRNRQVLYADGEARYPTVMRFGIRSMVRLNGETVAFLYNHDPEIDYMSRLASSIPRCSSSSSEPLSSSPSPFWSRMGCQNS